MEKFMVTTKASRPLGLPTQCFYCKSLLGDYHTWDCVLLRKTAKIRLIIEYPISVPYSHNKNDIEFQRNESSWCKSGLIDELNSLDEKLGCLCPIAFFECLDVGGTPFLEEE